ncbi:MAG: response regulator [Rhodobacterales bacterium]|nr:response regulator [Rhodobacterales bacterium]
MAPRILIVEDDTSILRGIELNLQLEGFETVTATDGRLGLQVASSGDIDLVVLDVMLPQMNGYQLVQRLRAQGSDLPIILLSAKTAEIDIIMGLDLGADDYVTKPFKVAELLARIKAHLRRRTPTEQYVFGAIQVDFDAREVSRDGLVVDMSSREYEVLVFLIEQEGKALTRDTILSEVWGKHYFGTDRTVDNFITKLRQKVDTPSSPQHIRTVRGVGYRFVSGADD